jgi:hypothetical protein
MRNTHLLIGLLSVPFLLMYGLSAAQMAHQKWFKPEPVIRKQTIAVSPADASDARSLARVLMALGHIRGEVRRAETTPNGYKVGVVRPGTVQDVDYDRAKGQATIKTSTSDFVFMLNRLHHVAGIRHDYGLLNAWGWALGLTGALLIVLAVTGIYLWFKMHGELIMGLILLTLSLGYSLALLYALRIT